jgi:ADP-heptose:LPS heptosyltransferase
VTDEFVAYLKDFPHRPLGKKILFLDSCHSSLISQTKDVWERVIPERADVRRVSRFSFRDLRDLRSEKFDAAIVFLSGERGFFKLKLLPFLLGIPEIVIINENANYFYANPRSLIRFFYQRVRHGSALPTPQPLVLFIQTESAEYIAHALQRLEKEKLFPDSEVVLFCREDDREELEACPQVHRFITFRKGLSRSNFQSWRELRKLSPDIVASVFSGRSVFRKQKMLFLRFWDRPQLIFNADLNCYWLKLRTLPRVLKKDELRFKPPEIVGTNVLMVQTEDYRYVEVAIRKIKSQKLYPRANITVVCREADSKNLKGLPGVSNVIPFSKQSGLLAVSRKIKEFNPEVVSAVFSGRGVFRKQKLLFFRYFRLRQLAFNARLDAYTMTWRTFPRIFRQEPLLFEDSQENLDEILLIQTESDGETLQAVKTLLSGKVVPNEKIAILCSEDKKEAFGELPAVERVYTYKPGRFFANLGTLRELIRTNRDVVGALFTGRPIYRFQKLLFFVLPARNRLVFNENQDCFYLKRGRFARLFRLPSLFQAVTSGSQMAGTFHYLRQAAKALLFIPRFIYLLSWITVMKLKRSYALGKKAT